RILRHVAGYEYWSRRIADHRTCELAARCYVPPREHVFHGKPEHSREGDTATDFFRHTRGGADCAPDGWVAKSGLHFRDYRYGRRQHLDAGHFRVRPRRDRSRREGS